MSTGQDAATVDTKVHFGEYDHYNSLKLESCLLGLRNERLEIAR